MIYAEPKDVVACYRLLLGREPDQLGLKNFTNLVNTSQVKTTDLAALFIASPEFIGIQQAARQESDQTERVTLRDFSFEMEVAPAWNAINREISLTKAYEPHITREILRIPLEGKVFIDCGANIGYFTILACHRGAKVWSFEPNSRNVWLLMQNLKINGFSAEVYPYAVADREEVVVYNAIDGNGQIEPFTGRSLGVGQEIVRTVTLDKVLAGTPVDVMKLDIEGAEWLALSGAKSVLKNRPVLFLEFSPGGIEAVSGIPPLDFLYHFIGLGYQIEVVGPQTATPHSPAEIIDIVLQSPAAFADLKLSPA